MLAAYTMALVMLWIFEKGQNENVWNGTVRACEWANSSQLVLAFVQFKMCHLNGVPLETAISSSSCGLSIFVAHQKCIDIAKFIGSPCQF